MMFFSLFRGETHKNDVRQFCHEMADKCTDDSKLIDKRSARLLWNYLELLVKQNGVSAQC